VPSLVRALKFLAWASECEGLFGYHYSISEALSRFGEGIDKGTSSHFDAERPAYLE
jgi:hypothetical protein